MFKRISERLDFDGVGMEMKMYDLFHTVAFLLLIFSCFLIDFFFESKVILFVTLGMAFMFLMTMIEANRTGRFLACAVVMSIAFNFFYMPILLWGFGKSIYVIPIFFLFGTTYTATMLEKNKAVILGVVELIFYIVCIYMYLKASKFDYSDISSKERFDIYLGAVAGVLFISLFIGIIARYRYLIFGKEEQKSKESSEHALEEYISKDTFLTNMSHELRTPMNAIVGNVNLILDENEDIRVRDTAHSILNSCDALISIVNELMDLSKTGNKPGELEIHRFDIYELFFEIINMISVRTMDTTSEIYFDISKNLPQYVYGDASKIRQVIVWVLNIACRYLKDGNIRIVAKGENTSDGGFIFRCQIICEGFHENIVVRRDDEEQSVLNYLEILDKMGGSAVNKQDGTSSCVYISIPLNIAENKCVASSLERIEGIKVLFIEKNEGRKSAIRKVMNDLLVDATEADTIDDLIMLLDSKAYTHLMIASELYSEDYENLRQHIGNEKVITFSNVGGNIENRGVYATIMRPAHVVNVFGALAGDDIYFVHRSAQYGDFELINATILVVDDNFTNLNVASSLLKKYGADILTASSGIDALHILSEKRVDLVFLDYMMPDLNGIDTLNMIRELDNEQNRNVSVVALSANVVSGAYEMFMKSGFDGFIPKPIDVGKLEKCLRKLMPSECIKYKEMTI